MRVRSCACVPGKSLKGTAYVVAAALLVSTHGCGAPQRGPYVTPPIGSRDSALAQELTQRAAEFMDRDPAAAHRLLCDALSHDLYHGPAHNNLAVLWLRQGRLYEAASEFEWACKLMPGHPDPRLNLAITLERAGRFDDALATYDTALEIYPNHLPTVQALTRLQLRHDRADDRTSAFLHEIALRGDTPQWRDWARGQMSHRAQ